MQPNENNNQTNNLTGNEASPTPASPNIDNDAMQPTQPPEPATSSFAPEQPNQNIKTSTNLNSSLNATIKTEPVQPANNKPPVTANEQQLVGQNPNLTIVNNVPKPKKSPVVAIIIILLILVLAAGGAAAYFILGNNKKKAEQQAANNQTPISTSQTTNTAVPEGFKSYENKDLGFKFNYPTEWGEINMTQSFINKAEFEPVKTYFVGFSNRDKFSIVIAPTNWKFTGGESEWKFPLNEASFATAKKIEGNVLSIYDNASSFLMLEYRGISGDVELTGAKQIELNKIPAKYAEFKWSSVADTCAVASKITINGIENDTKKPQLSCYPQADIDNTKAIIQSFTAL